MTNSEIIRVYKLQSSKCDSTQTWLNAMSIKLERADLIQALESLGHCNNIIEDDKRRLEWYKLNSWSSLVSMMDCALGLNTDSFLNTIN